MQWLDIRLQLMGAAVVSAIAGIALVQHQRGLANPGAALRPFPLPSGVCQSQPLLCTVPPTFMPPTQVPCEAVGILITPVLELRKLSLKESFTLVVVDLRLEGVL